MFLSPLFFDLIESMKSGFDNYSQQSDCFNFCTLFNCQTHELPPRQEQPKLSQYTKTPDNRNFSPESSQYRAWELPKREPVPPVQRPGSLPFRAQSSYQTDYIPHSVQVHRQPVPPSKTPTENTI